MRPLLAVSSWLKRVVSRRRVVVGWTVVVLLALVTASASADGSGGPTIPGETALLAFTQTVSSVKRLEAYDPGTGDWTTVSATSSPGGPVWSPDHSQLAFNTLAGLKIWDGSSIVVTALGAGVASWARDGHAVLSWVPSICCDRGWVSVYDISTDTNTNYNTETDVWFDIISGASWMPDSRTIIFTGQCGELTSGCTDFGDWNIFALDTEDGSVDQLTTDDAGVYRYPRVSPDGSQILYDGPSGLCHMPAPGGSGGSGCYSGIGNGLGQQGYGWAPDGSWAAFDSDGTLFVDGDQVGTTAQFDVAGDAAVPLVWSPDSTYLLLSGGRLVTAATGSESSLGSPLSTGGEYAWAGDRPFASAPPPEQSYGTDENGLGIHGDGATVSVLEPVNTFLGALIVSAIDLRLPGVGVPFSFVRTYTSADERSGRLGAGWTDSYSASLAVLGNGDVILHGEDGQRLRYTLQGDDSFTGAPGARSALSAVDGGYDLTRHDQVVYHFDENGVLETMLDRNGQGVTLGYDGGKLVSVTDATNREATISYDGDLISSVESPDGRVVTYDYTDGLLTGVTYSDPDGAGPLEAPETTYTYEEVWGRLATETDPNGHIVLTNVYDEDTGRVIEQTDATDNTTSFDWNPATQTMTVSDANAHEWIDRYENHVLVERESPGGQVTQIVRSPNLDITSVISPDGESTTSLEYDENHNLLVATAPDSLENVEKTFTYDEQNNIETVTDARSYVTELDYDPAGNNTEVMLDEVPVLSGTYSETGQLETSTDAEGNETTYTYDPDTGDRLSITEPDPDGAGPLEHPVTTFTYDDMGNVLTEVDPLGNCTGCDPEEHTTTYTYDALGRLLAQTDQLDNTTTYEYDPAGNRKSITDANGNATTYDYDEANRLVGTIGPDPDGTGPREAPITTYEYDDVGNPISSVDPNGNCDGCTPAEHTTTWSFDENNRLESVTTPSGATSTSTYDDNGFLSSSVDPRGYETGADPLDFTTLYSNDAAGRLLTSEDPLEHVTTNVYDEVGNLESSEDANEHAMAYTYDAAGRVLTVTAPDGGVTTYTYDNNGNIETRTDDNGHTTSYSYDAAARLSETTGPDPDGAGPDGPPVTSYSYDLNGNLKTLTDPNGGTITYGYDHANRLTDIDYDDATPDVSYTYDNVGNRLTMTDGAGTITTTYDNLDQLASIGRPGELFHYSYDVAGNLINRTYPDDTELDYDYDADNRLTSLETRRHHELRLRRRR